MEVVRIEIRSVVVLRVVATAVSTTTTSAAAGRLSLRLRLGGRELVVGERLLVVVALDLGPRVVLVAQLLRLQSPALAAHLRNHLMVVVALFGLPLADALLPPPDVVEPLPLLGAVLVRLAVEHEGVHGPLDLARLGRRYLAPPFLGGPTHVGLDIRVRHVGDVLDELAERRLERELLLVGRSVGPGLLPLLGGPGLGRRCRLLDARRAGERVGQ